MRNIVFYLLITCLYTIVQALWGFIAGPFHPIFWFIGMIYLAMWQILTYKFFIKS